jgi:hypothetical protein
MRFCLLKHLRARFVLVCSLAGVHASLESTQDGQPCVRQSAAQGCPGCHSPLGSSTFSRQNVAEQQDQGGLGPAAPG